jgi:hypothetical protein
MNWRLRSHLGLAVLLLYAVGFWYWDSQRVSEAEARAERAEETARHVKELEAELVWRRVDDAVQALEPEMEEPKRREAVERLKQEIQRLKSNFKYRQLGLAR